jgi:release factor glutamine methyltransferase
LKVAEALARSGIEAREARMLLAQAAEASLARVVGFPEVELTSEAARCFFDFVRRRQAGEPIAYILGRREFYGLELEVTADVLVPRPETELLVELALERNFRSVLDLGTGSGAIAIALKQARPEARVAAVEASAAALSVARRNAARHRVEVQFLHGRWFGPVGRESFDLVLANPPYVAIGDPHLRDLAFEPREALVSGADGLDAMREITGQVMAHLQPGGWVLLEHGRGQEAAVRGLLANAGLELVASWPDLAGIPRVSGGKR